MGTPSTTGDASIPQLDAFIDASIEEVRAVAPATFIYAASGTRRAAVLAGLPDQGDTYARWTRQQLFRCIGLIFEHGVEKSLLLATPRIEGREGVRQPQELRASLLLCSKKIPQCVGLAPHLKKHGGMDSVERSHLTAPLKSLG